MNAAACCLGVSGLQSPPIGQALPDNAFERLHGAGVVVIAETGAVAHAEIELRQIARKMLFAHMLVGANEPALEDREIAFGAVDMNFLAMLAVADKFLVVIDGF